jgi:hypothetical protein
MIGVGKANQFTRKPSVELGFTGPTAFKCWIHRGGDPVVFATEGAVGLYVALLEQHLQHDGLRGHSVGLLDRETGRAETRLPGARRSETTGAIEADRRDDHGIENGLSPAESSDVAAAAATSTTIVGGCRLWQFLGVTDSPSSSMSRFLRVWFWSVSSHRTMSIRRGRIRPLAGQCAKRSIRSRVSDSGRPPSLTPTSPPPSAPRSKSRLLLMFNRCTTGPDGRAQSRRKR